MDDMPIDGERRLAALADDLQARGRYTFTRGEALATARRSDVALAAARRRLEQRGRIASLRRGFYVLVPLEYREAGCPPASWFIDDLMRFLGQPYYVGLLSAAALHGAAHQQPMAFQVVTDRPTRPARAGRVRIEFHMSRHVAAAAVVQVQTETGTMRVSTPEITAFDLVRFAAAAGHLSNVASVLGEFGDKLDPAALAHVAPSYAVPEAQRLGYLLDHLGALDRTRPLSAWITARRHGRFVSRPARHPARQLPTRVGASSPTQPWRSTSDPARPRHGLARDGALAHRRTGRARPRAVAGAGRAVRIEELLGTKLRALYQRKKGRDLYDLWLALTSLEVDDQRVVECFGRYMDESGARVSRAEFEANLSAKLHMPAFCDDIGPLLPTGVIYDASAAGAMVQARLITKLPGEPWKGVGS